MSGISTLGSLMSQRSLNTSMQKQLVTLTAENSSGIYQNAPVQMGSSLTAFYQLSTQLSKQNAAQTAAANVGNKLSTMQTALTSINTLVSSMSTTSVAAMSNTGSQGTLYTATSATAENSINQMLTLLNTTYDGQYVFSGTDSGTQAVTPDSTSLDSAMSTLVNNAVSSNGGPLDSSSVSSLIDSINDMFSDATGSSSTNYTGAVFTATDSGQPVTFSVGGTQTLSYNLTADSDGMRNVMKGMAMLSLLNSPDTEMDDTAKAALVSAATSAISEGQQSLTNETATLGSVQSALTNLSTAQSSAASATQTLMVNMSSVDPYTAATQLQALQTQLEASYSVTSKISQLSFVNYMQGT